MEKGVKILTEEELLALLPKPNPASESSSVSKQFSEARAAGVPLRGAPTQELNIEAMPAVAEELLWVDKYKPGHTHDIIGTDSTFKNLLQWLKYWEARHLQKTLKLPAYTKENPGAKAVLLSGPPGIGKTTVASLVAREAGYELLELNASDVRSKKAVNEELANVVLSQAMNGQGQMRKRLVIMDEVDGMGGQDRGGIQELIKIIKASKSPIICICNDRMHTKIRSLANHCYDCRVKRPVNLRLVHDLCKSG